MRYLFFISRCALITLATCLATGCAQQRLRDDSQRLLQEGKYEQAIEGLEKGLRSHPDSSLLRAGLVQARSDVLTRLLAEAASARASGRFDEAEAALARAVAFDAGGKRTASLLSDLATERRQRKAMADAAQLVDRGQPQLALQTLSEALKDNHRHPGLQALQRKVELDLRQQQQAAARQGLAETRVISLDFRDASLRTVLDVVTRNSGINFILDKDLRQDARVTVFLRSARVEDAIDLLISTHQLAKKVIDDQTILIYPNTPEKIREHQEQVIKVFYLASAEAKSAAAFLRSMLRIRDPYVDERTNMLAIRESAENIALAERLVALYDTGEPEVLLELEVIEVRSSRLLDLGVKVPDTFSLSIIPPAGGLTLADLPDLGRRDVGVGIGGLLVNLRREVGDVNTLANPRIRAKSKEKAKVLIGDKVPVITTTTGQGGFVSDSVSYLDVGLKLDVEPTVYADDEVAIRIALEVSSIAREVRTGSGGLAYQIGTRNASTLLRLKDGETQLLAGLISNEERSSASRVPGIGDLPVMGRLFSAQRDDSQRTELVLAITPRILRNIRRPDANETELWIGTESSPRIRAVGGRSPMAAIKPDAAPRSATSGAAPIGGAAAVSPSTAPPTRAAVGVKLAGPAEAKVGELLAVTLEINTPVPLRGAPLQLSYSKELLELVQIEEGSFFKQGGVSTSFSKGIDVATGTARVGLIRSQASGAIGQGSLVTLKFKALKAGAAEVSMSSMSPVVAGDHPANPPPATSHRLQVK